MSKLSSASTQETVTSEMTTEDLLRLLKEKQIHIHAHEGRLKVSAPSGAIDASLKAELKARKAALLEALSKAAAGTEASSALVPLSAAELGGRIPLTPAQQGMWLIDHFNPGNLAYNIPEAFRFEQPIELETMQAAVDQLLARHSILRTSFHEDDGELFQSIATALEARVGFTDLSSLPEAERDRRCRELIRRGARRPFDLQQAPLVRFHLFRLAGQRHVFFLNIHHIIADRVSLYVLREELVVLGGASHSAAEAMLPALQFQFADYASWLARQMRSEAMERQVVYWKKKLAGLPGYLELPHSRPWPDKRTSSGAVRQIPVTAAAREALNRVGAEEGASPFMTFLAFFAVSLARWSRGNQTGPADFCIGSPITHRRDAATQRMIGPFVNMLAFRCRIEPGMGFREVVRQVRGTALEAYENSDVPFQRLVREINPDRRSQRSPIFQVMFGYETYLPPVANEFRMDAGPGTARYDLALHLSETSSKGLIGAIEYSTDLFTEADIEKLATIGEAVAVEIMRELGRETGTIPGDSTPSTSQDSPAGKAEAEDGRTRKVRGRIARLFSRL